jgi:plastocyanin
VHQIRLLLISLLVVAATALAPGSARPAGTSPTPLTGTVGPGYTISLTTASGSTVSRLSPGAYTITVHNLSDGTHNFHLRGPGVNENTPFAPGTYTINVTLVDGTYTYVCDAHPTIMHKTFAVGPPLPPKLKGKVGPGSTISLRKASGSLVKTLKAGKYRIAVSDLTSKDNFHLLGPGVSKKTGVKARTSVTWTVTLRAGKYAYFSDAHRTLRRTFRATS